jgi:NAD(P) transhydrogenase subunit alpha
MDRLHESSVAQAFQPAVSQVFNLQNSGGLQQVADWKSALPQTESVRYGDPIARDLQGANYAGLAANADPGQLPHLDHATHSPFELVSALFVFMLAAFVGLEVIRRVSRLLHTPLMSLTNAISAIAVVGAILVAGPGHPPLIHWLGLVALVASVANIVSGFLITDRMLKLFRKKEPKTSK